MGFRRPLDYNSVQHQIYLTGVELRDHRNDGFTQWELKKDLYQLKFLLDEIIDNSPQFSGEQEYLEECSKKKVVSVLSR